MAHAYTCYFVSKINAFQSKLVKTRAYFSVKSYYYTYCIVDMSYENIILLIEWFQYWNSLPNEVVMADNLYNKRRYVCLSVCLTVSMFRMAGQTAGPIETKLDTRTHVHPGSVSVKVNVKVIHVCVRE